jgi:hypothetical protein
MKNYIAEYMKDNDLKIGVEFKIKGYGCWFRFPNTSYLQNKNGVGEWENSRANDVMIAQLLRGERVVEK